MVIGLAACGASSGNKQSGNVLGADAATTVRQGAGSLLDQQGFSVKMSLGVTGAQLDQLQKQYSDGNSSSLAPRKALDALANGSLTVDVHTTNGSTLSQDFSRQSTSSDMAMDMALTVNGNTPVEVRLIDLKAYAKVDLQQLTRDFNAPNSEVQKFKSETQAANAMIPGAAALGQGHWVGADLTPLEQLSQQMGSSTWTPQELRSLISNIEQGFTQNSTSHEVGTKNGRTEYDVTVDAGAFANSALSSLKNLPNIGNAINNDTSKLPTGQMVTLQVYEHGGRVAEVDLNLMQFAHQPKVSFPVPLRFQFGTGSSVSAPSGVTNIDLTKALQVLNSMSSGGSTGS
jgi:hypothetical protein